MKSKVGFFGGTFDPIHFGHLSLALNILEIQTLDQIFFCPANFSPGKKRAPIASKKARREMTELGIEKIQAFTVIENEIEREGPSFTIDTINFLQKQYPEVQFYVILGEDTLQGLSKWKEIETLLHIAPPLVGTRPGNTISLKLPPTLQEKIQKGMIPIPRMEISATDIRKRLFGKKYCGHLVPDKVLDYIAHHNLYLETRILD